MEEVTFTQREAAELVALRKVVRGEMFTAYDITRGLRDEGLTVYHSDIRTYVRELFEAGAFNTYEVESGEVADGVYAMVYRPLFTSAADYRSQPVLGVSNTVSKAVDEAFHYNSILPDARGRFCIPVEATRAIGLQPGDTAVLRRVRLLIGGDFSGYEITTQGNSIGSDATFVVDRDGNIRLTPTVLGEVGLRDEGVLDIRYNDRWLYIGTPEVIAEMP